MALLSKNNEFRLRYGRAALVINVGALFKITHFEFGPLTGTLMLSIGLLVEAAILLYLLSEPVEDRIGLDFSLSRIS